MRYVEMKRQLPKTSTKPAYRTSHGNTMIVKHMYPWMSTRFGYIYFISVVMINRCSNPDRLVWIITCTLLIMNDRQIKSWLTDSKHFPQIKTTCTNASLPVLWASIHVYMRYFAYNLSRIYIYVRWWFGTWPTPVDGQNERIADNLWPNFHLSPASTCLGYPSVRKSRHKNPATEKYVALSEKGTAPFCLFSSTTCPFRDKNRKCTEWTQNDLEHLTVIGT